MCWNEAHSVLNKRRENRRGNQEWTIQWHRQLWAPDIEQNKKHKNYKDKQHELTNNPRVNPGTHEEYTASNTELTKNPRVNPGAHEG
jgi:hypothetical protein